MGDKKLSEYLRLQRLEATESEVYRRLASRHKNEESRKILNEIAIEEYYFDEALVGDGFINSGETVELYVETQSNILLNEGEFLASINSLSGNVNILTPSIGFDLSENNLIYINIFEVKIILMTCII